MGMDPGTLSVPWLRLRAAPGAKSQPLPPPILRKEPEQ